MTILELENRTGLERATIRFYEREGMISPERKENSYRDYSETDLQEILKIKLLRQLDLPLSQIKALQTGSADIGSVLREHSAVLLQQVHATECAAKICEEISAAAVTYQTLNATEYLKKIAADVTATEDQGYVRPRRVNNLEYHPIRRYVARVTDYAIVRVTIQFLLIVVLRIRPFPDWLSRLIEYGTIFLCVPLMALSLSKFGTTPGKWMMGIRAESLSGRLLCYQDALTREWTVLRRGYGFCIPIWSLWRMYKSYKEYHDWQYVEWDTGVDYHYTYLYVRKKSVFAATCTLLIAMACINATDVVKPRHRGSDLTVAELAENYNFYVDVLKKGTYMNSDGTWYVSKPTENGNTIIIELAKPEKVNEPFRFETEGDRITRITYENSWSDIQMLTPLGNNMSNAIFTAVYSQRGFGIRKLDKFTELLKEYADEETANIRFENIEIRWSIESENCIHSNGTFYADDKTKPSRVSLILEIMIHDVD